MIVSVEFDSAKLEAALEKQGARFADVCVKALEGAAAIVSAEAAIRAPVRYGRLRRSIRRGEVYAESDGALAIDVIGGGAEVVYAGYIEFGTKYIEPRRFMRGALEAKEPEVTRLLEAAVTLAFEEDG